jgi:chromosomal replication initiation ATPase DnaA
MEEIWKAVLEYVHDKISHEDYQVWIKPIMLASVTEQLIEVEVPNKFFEDWLRGNARFFSN